MKLYGWIFLAMMAGVHLLAWGVYGKAEPEQALHLLVFLCPMLCGAFLVWFFTCNRPWVWLPPLLLLATQIEITASSRSSPRSSLWQHYLDTSFERPIGSWEAFFAGLVLLFLMLCLLAVTAFLTAEVHGWFSGQGKGAGFRFWMTVERDMSHWEKQHGKETTKGP